MAPADQLQDPLPVFLLQSTADHHSVDIARLLYNYLVMELTGYQNTNHDLNAVFSALADPTRRAILSSLSTGEKTVNELARPLPMSQPAVSKHLKVLEHAGLIERDINKQTRPARLKAAPMAEAVKWLEEFRTFWTGSFDQLDTLLADLKTKKADRNH